MSSTETQRQAENLVKELNTQAENLSIEIDVSKRVKGGFNASHVDALPKLAREYLERHGVDLSKGYPEKPQSEQIPLYVDDALKIRNTPQEYIPRGKNADRETKALFSKVKEVKHLTKYICTELVGVQLADLNEQ